jgi:RNA polymerase sigma-70 factor (ECF subfamily)
MTDRESDDLAMFESHRHDLVALAYRMLGDVGRAQDVVQEAWLRWYRRDGEVEAPRAFLVTIVTRLCLNELASARARREESRSDRLPEPVDLERAGMGRLEALDQVSMAFLVLLERLTPRERAVLLLHDVFDFTHDEIAPLLERSPGACRKLLERARQGVSAGRRLITASREQHERLLHAFVGAVTAGDVAALVELLAADAVLVTDGGPDGRRVGRFRNLTRPLEGAAGVAAFIMATARDARLDIDLRELNGRSALVLSDGEGVVAALLIAVADDRIQRLFFHADAQRLRYLGPTSRSGPATST